MPTNISPSSVARTLAAALWPDVQHQYKVTRGVYGFSCAGHGGLVAVLGEADLPANAIEAARTSRLIELVAVVQQGRTTRRYTSEKFTPESLRKLARDPRVHLFECWVGEEDCDWATIALVSPAVREGMERNGCSRTTEAATLQCCENWCERYLMALDPSREPIPGGQIATAKRKEAILDAGGVTLAAAWGSTAENGIPEGYDRVLFRGRGDRTESYLMPAELYAKRGDLPFPMDATPDEFAALGTIIRERADTDQAA